MMFMQEQDMRACCIVLYYVWMIHGCEETFIHQSPYRVHFSLEQESILCVQNASVEGEFGLT